MGRRDEIGGEGKGSGEKRNKDGEGRGGGEKGRREGEGGRVGEGEGDKRQLFISRMCD